MRQLQRLRVLDQNARTRRHASPSHDGHRRGQAQGARTSNHQHRHRANQRYLQRLAHGQPTEQSGQANQQDHGHKHGGDLVDQALNRRLSSLGIFHQTDDFGQHGVTPDRADEHDHTTIAVDAAAGERRLKLLGDGQRLTREHGFIDLRAAFCQHTVNRDALAGQDHHAIIHQQLRHRHIGLLAGAQDDVRQRWAQGMQCANGRSGLTLCPRL